MTSQKTLKKNHKRNPFVDNNNVPSNMTYSYFILLRIFLNLTGDSVSIKGLDELHIKKNSPYLKIGLLPRAYGYNNLTSIFRKKNGKQEFVTHEQKHLRSDWLQSIYRRIRAILCVLFHEVSMHFCR